MRERKIVPWLKEHPLLLLVLLVAVLDAVFFAAVFPREREVLTVRFLDVGQGDAVFIEAPNGNQLLYDAGGPSGAVLRALAEAMPFWDRSIDVVVLSHPDLDHIGGFPEVFKRYRIALLLEPGATSDNGAYAATMEALRAEGSAHFLARKGMTIDLGGGVFADVLYPDRDMSDMETNSASVILRIRYGETAFLLSGDLPKDLEEYAVAIYGNKLEAEVLKLGHHGSRTSSSEAWLRAVQPDVAIISAGKGNRYGHPHIEVITLLGRLGIPSVATFADGTIIFESDGTRVEKEGASR
ncbi:MAG: hypothetical protein A3C93_00825 [Candidatus Lloydbacteria bacterium RIFCSPHIGHO2_02_FULL_54_17]|uniref:Metallo-beta-lactamase domain-containing protein n=1 Tax=Candidatus Lloydbacteria bacterium RIFCSPHIGHO2_02_FULL_54_17 TaxID=1798664 RepID=A0A1G2DF64_9BACT|nr:MAG: hypothetical protein A2762_06265 [Candidatus Lloydbacteria bacterium RIFCSPHIGHO2_01_FULL_54_11]OGZ12183.1 MAG: hypothetical protein A3C93_00825 [Candidatus Lloydbacteria bacterium RIFCSPHIGHO2_02_FULL_54_17]OGZ12974.1 MAG: hypothetical protein A2948_01270 [Candidatus Lloydbacteria bacterium RIFCSPLOWO2_01_FULL_54_18]